MAYPRLAPKGRAQTLRTGPRRNPRLEKRETWGTLSFLWQPKTRGTSIIRRGDLGHPLLDLSFYLLAFGVLKIL